MSRIRGRLVKLERQRSAPRPRPRVNWAGLPTLTGSMFVDGTGPLWADLAGWHEEEDDPVEAAIEAAGRPPYGLKELPADEARLDATPGPVPDGG
jgi:hypothetical protein